MIPFTSREGSALRDAVESGLASATMPGLKVAE